MTSTSLPRRNAQTRTATLAPTSAKTVDIPQRKKKTAKESPHWFADFVRRLRTSSWRAMLRILPLHRCSWSTRSNAMRRKIRIQILRISPKKKTPGKSSRTSRSKSSRKRRYRICNLRGWRLEKEIAPTCCLFDKLAITGDFVKIIQTFVTH